MVNEGVLLAVGEQGNLGQTVLVGRNDEVGHLAAIFNRMSQTLEASSKLRRQLLANIVHELRTPLAVIQGHLEGMIVPLPFCNGFVAALLS